MNLLLFCRNCISAFIEKVQIQIFFATQRAPNKWLGYKYLGLSGNIDFLLPKLKKFVITLGVLHSYIIAGNGEKDGCL